MFKKENFKKLENKYRSHAYEGLMGFFMKICHKNLEKYDFPKNISKVLEIGAGDSPHIEYIKHSFDEYHIIETSDYALSQDFNNSKVKVSKYDGKNIPYPNKTFDRIIIVKIFTPFTLLYIGNPQFLFYLNIIFIEKN